MIGVLFFLPAVCHPSSSGVFGVDVAWAAAVSLGVGVEPLLVGSGSDLPLDVVVGGADGVDGPAADGAVPPGDLDFDLDFLPAPLSFFPALAFAMAVSWIWR